MENKCKKGYKLKDGKCIKTTKSQLNKQVYFGLEPSQRFGFLLLILGALIWYFKPSGGCSWYQIFCHVGNISTGPIYFAISALLALGGVIYITKADKIIFNYFV